MITGFEHKKLSKKQIECTDYIVNLFKQNKDKYILNAELRLCLLELKGVSFDSAEIRHIIHLIRCNNLLPVIIATSKGYKYTTDQKDVELYIDSLEDRIRTITDLKKAIQDGQTRLQQAYPQAT